MSQSLRLLPKVYSLRAANGQPRVPSTLDGVRQFFHSLNFFADRRRLLHALFESSHVLSSVPALLFFVYYANLQSLAAYFAMFYVLSNFWNTIWYHRYCSHHAFDFARPIWPKLCLWFNPVGFREEIYALIHHIHHVHADTDQDPHGPRIGWLPNYVATSFEVDTDVTEQEYARIKARLAHIGMPFSSRESFHRWGCVERIPHYLARWLFAGTWWASLAYALGGLDFVMAWWAAMFSYNAVLRDFDYRGHGKPERTRQVDGWDFDRRSYALNQRFYGWTAGEWHNNHHACPASANTAFLPGQIDVPFWVIRQLHRMGIVSRFKDHRPQFVRRFQTELAKCGRLRSDGEAALSQLARR